MFSVSDRLVPYDIANPGFEPDPIGFVHGRMTFPAILGHEEIFHLFTLRQLQLLPLSACLAASDPVLSDPLAQFHPSTGDVHPGVGHETELLSQREPKIPHFSCPLFLQRPKSILF